MAVPAVEHGALRKNTLIPPPKDTMEIYEELGLIQVEPASYGIERTAERDKMFDDIMSRLAVTRSVCCFDLEFIQAYVDSLRK